MAQSSVSYANFDIDRLEISTKFSTATNKKTGKSSEFVEYFYWYPVLQKDQTIKDIKNTFYLESPVLQAYKLHPATIYDQDPTKRAAKPGFFKWYSTIDDQGDENHAKFIHVLDLIYNKTTSVIASAGIVFNAKKQPVTEVFLLENMKSVYSTVKDEQTGSEVKLMIIDNLNLNTRFLKPDIAKDKQGNMILDALGRPEMVGVQQPANSILPPDQSIESLRSFKPFEYKYVVKLQFARTGNIAIQKQINKIMILKMIERSGFDASSLLSGTDTSVSDITAINSAYGGVNEMKMSEYDLNRMAYNQPLDARVSAGRTSSSRTSASRTSNGRTANARTSASRSSTKTGGGFDSFMTSEGFGAIRQ